MRRRPKPQRSSKPGWAADAAALLGRPRRNFAHRQRIAGMEAAGDIGGAHNLQHRVVMTDVVGSKALAHIRVEVDENRHGGPSIS